MDAAWAGFMFDEDLNKPRASETTRNIPKEGYSALMACIDASTFSVSVMFSASRPPIGMNRGDSDVDFIKDFIDEGLVTGNAPRLVESGLVFE
jgi:hypothetical protein